MLYFLFNFKNNSIYNFFLSAILMIDSYDEISSWDQSTQAFIIRNIFLHFILILDTNRQVYQMFKHPVIFYIYYNILCQLEFMYVCPISASILNYLLKVPLLLDLNFLKYSWFLNLRFPQATKIQLSFTLLQH